MIRDGLARLHVHVERHRRSAGHPNLNAVRPWCQIKMLERAVEIVDDASVVAVGENLRVTRRSRDAHATVGWSGSDVAWRVRVTVPVPTVVAIRIAEPDRDSTIWKAEAEPDRQPWPVGIVGVSIAIVGISIAVVGIVGIAIVRIVGMV